jgi:hypothetical protein
MRRGCPLKSFLVVHSFFHECFKFLRAELFGQKICCTIALLFTIGLESTKVLDVEPKSTSFYFFPNWIVPWDNSRFYLADHLPNLICEARLFLVYPNPTFFISRMRTKWF